MSDLEYTFCRSSDGSYLVIRTQALSEGYLRKMLKANRMEMLLEEHVLQIGDHMELHYRISGMQTLEKRFCARRMQTKDVVSLLDQIVALRETCAGCLLPDRHLFVEPSLVYAVHLEDMYRFLYLPEVEVSFEAQVRLLADFMMKHVSYDPGEDAGVETVYALQDAAGREGFDLTVWWHDNRPQMYTGAKQPAESIFRAQETDAWYMPGGGFVKSGSRERTPASDHAAEQGSLPAEFGDLKIISLTDNWDLKWDGEAPAEKHDAAGRFSFLKRRRTKRKKGSEREKKKKKEKRLPDAKQTGYAAPQPDTAFAAWRPQLMQADPMQPGLMQPGLEQPGTVCLDAGTQAQDVPVCAVHALIPLDGSAQIPIRDPYMLIGTAARNVDIVLEDRTVSRVHAALYTDAEGVRIEDCNSSNGTFLDGEPLEPNERRNLQSGMHIRMGRTEFVFR